MDEPIKVISPDAVVEPPALEPIEIIEHPPTHGIETPPIEVRGAVFANAANSLIDCEFNHPQYGWIPTTLIPDGDDRPELLAEVLAGEVAPFVAPVKTAEQLYAEAKAARLAQLAALTVTTSQGHTFDADKPALQALTSALVLGEPGQVTPWKLADNSVISASWEELREAALLAGQAQTALIAV